MLERMWLIFFTVSYVLLYGFGQINLLTTATAFMGSICMFLGAKAKISNFYPGAIYTLLYAWQCYLFDFKTVLYLHLMFHFPLQFVGWHYWRKNRVCMNTMQEDIVVRQLFPPWLDCRAAQPDISEYIFCPNCLKHGRRQTRIGHFGLYFQHCRTIADDRQVH